MGPQSRACRRDRGALSARSDGVSRTPAAPRSPRPRGHRGRLMSITVLEQGRMAARLAEIRPFLDERAWRLMLGAEARAIGYGGMKAVAEAAKAKADTVSRGAHELE